MIQPRSSPRFAVILDILSKKTRFLRPGRLGNLGAG